ncbi:MAG: class I SAM-dependent methyltransferase [Janthinobacterium lividum]
MKTFLDKPARRQRAIWRSMATFCMAASLSTIGVASYAAEGTAPASNPGAPATPAAADASLAAVIAGPQRKPADQARDVYRHPLETLQFFQLRPDQTVIEIAPGNGWYTDILAPFLRDHGSLYEALYLHDGPPSPEASQAADRFRGKLAASPGVYGTVTVGSLQAGRFEGIDPPGGADRVLTFRNIHNWIKDGHFDDNLRAFYKVLKPGGMLGVEEHRANPGTSLQQMISSGYVTEAYIIEHARAAGFKLAGRSEINSNPRDTKDYPDGVWTLPPTLADGDQSRARYLAIGESDRMTLRFIKPGRQAKR